MYSPPNRSSVRNSNTIARPAYQWRTGKINEDQTLQEYTSGRETVSRHLMLFFKRLQMNMLYLFIEEKSAFLYFLLKHTRCEDNFVHCRETVEAFYCSKSNESVKA